MDPGTGCSNSEKYSDALVGACSAAYFSTQAQSSTQNSWCEAIFNLFGTGLVSTKTHNSLFASRRDSGISKAVANLE